MGEPLRCEVVGCQAMLHPTTAAAQPWGFTSAWSCDGAMAHHHDRFYAPNGVTRLPRIPEEVFTRPRQISPARPARGSPSSPAGAAARPPPVQLAREPFRNGSKSP